MKKPVGSTVYFIKGFFDSNSERSGDVLVRKEGTIYLSRCYPKDKENEVIVGEITRTRGEISLPYFMEFLTFSKKDMWGSNVSPNSNKNGTLSPLEIEIKKDNFRTISLETEKDARDFANLLTKKRIGFTLSGRHIIDIENITMARAIWRRYGEGKINKDKYEPFKFNFEEEFMKGNGNEDIII